MVVRCIILLLIFILLGCGVDQSGELALHLKWPPRWVESIETLPRLDGYQHAGIFDMNDTFIAQFCDPHGNQRWMKFDEETKEWFSTKYVTLGCKNN